MHGINASLPAGETGVYVHNQAELAQAFLNEHLDAADLAVINGSGVQGAPLVVDGLLPTYTKVLYRDTSGHEDLPAYYDPIDNIRTDAAIASLNLELQQTPAADSALLEKTIAGLRAARIDHENLCREQMIRLLDDAKQILRHRGVDTEPDVGAAIARIDSVLRKANAYADGGEANERADFLDLYTDEVKYQCEIAVMRGRNPFALMDMFDDTPGPLEQRWHTAMETARTHARVMAERLKALLEPYTEGAPSAAGNTSRDPATKAGTAHAASWKPV